MEYKNDDNDEKLLRVLRPHFRRMTPSQRDRAIRAMERVARDTRMKKAAESDE